MRLPFLIEIEEVMNMFPSDRTIFGVLLVDLKVLSLLQATSSVPMAKATRDTSVNLFTGHLSFPEVGRI
jgi:hypothetical protein